MTSFRSWVVNFINPTKAWAMTLLTIQYHLNYLYFQLITMRFWYFCGILENGFTMIKYHCTIINNTYFDFSVDVNKMSKCNLR